MRFLVVGHGAREHSLARRLVADGHEVVICASKCNAGLVSDFPHFIHIDHYDAESILQEAINHHVDIIIPCTEKALFGGIVDAAKLAGIPCLGHTKRVAEVLEKERSVVIGSMKTCGMVSPPKGAVITDKKDLLKIVGNRKMAVLKPLPAHVSSLSGVHFINVADEIPKECFPTWAEAYIPGVDFSVHYIVVGTKFYPLGTTVDYPLLSRKNDIVTSGMGAIAIPDEACDLLPPIITDQCRQMVENGLLRLQSKLRIQISGFVSAQFRKTRQGIIFTELDCKPGDPEIVALLPLLKVDLGYLFMQAVHSLPCPIVKHPFYSVAVPMIPRGYPLQVALGEHKIPMDVLGDTALSIGDLNKQSGCLASGTSRTLCINTVSESLPQAVAETMAKAASLSNSTGLLYRNDIGANISKPSATQRVKKSLQDLKVRGGKRLMLRLSPEALAATKKIMAEDGIKTETAAINAALIRCAGD
jgi:phosphoribosylamine--glycine ligase